MVLRFVHNSLSRRRRTKRVRGPLTTDAISKARDYLVRKAQSTADQNLESPGWKVVKDKETNHLVCEGRVQGYRPSYLPGGPFADKLITYVHNLIMHLGVSSTMGAIRDNWWIPKLRAKVKKAIRSCNVCKVFSTMQAY